MDADVLHQLVVDQVPSSVGKELALLVADVARSWIVEMIGA